MFCEGTSNSAAASAMSSAVAARLIANTASAVRPGVSAVHARDTAKDAGVTTEGRWTGMRSTASIESNTSETIGPCTVERTSISTGSPPLTRIRSEEHTSELQSRENLVCRLLLEKKKNLQ